MSFKILLHQRVAKQLERVEPNLRLRIKSRLKELEETPEQKGESLHPSDYWKTRIGDYRAIYQIDRSNKSIVIIFVGHRSKVYDDFEKML